MFVLLFSLFMFGFAVCGLLICVLLILFSLSVLVLSGLFVLFGLGDLLFVIDFLVWFVCDAVVCGLFVC